MMDKENTASKKWFKGQFQSMRENAEAISRETFGKLNDKKIRRRVVFILAVSLLVILLTAVFAAVCLTLFFRVDSVYVTGCERYDHSELIALSGIVPEMSIYEPDASAVEDEITLNYPYVKSVKLVRHLPSEIELRVSEDEPYYYMEIGGEFFVLSENLRVLERLEHDNGLNEAGLKKIVTPPVTYAVVGRHLRFKDPAEDANVKSLLASFRLSHVYDMLDLINISDKYGVYVIYGGQFKVVFGKYTDMDLKLLLVDGIIREMEDMQGVIDVSDIKTSYAIMDSTIVLE